MTETIEIQVLNAIKQAQRGPIFFVESFLFAGNAKAVNKALERLVAKGEIIRLAQGIYTRPKQSTLLGNVTPSVEEIAKAIASRDKARIVPTGVFALNALGLSTQVPLNVVYLTDGASRRIQIGKRSILFKRTAPKNLAAIGNISKLVIQALKSIGKDKVDPDEEKKILALLKKEKRKNLEQDIALAPEWIRKIMRKVLKRNLK
ncbi:MAG: type IV toxin-antitoxin system AbiEi family antitoxin domain-containing protein [Bacteroidetes bacterium]|nr:type IV toxin-antitoxin system AbiEi family antitoxin domain-containing protein [Bacteroidota bacterium]